LEIKRLYTEQDISEISFSYIDLPKFSKFYTQQIPELQRLIPLDLASSTILLLSLKEREREKKKKVLQKCILEESRAWVFPFGM